VYNAGHNRELTIRGIILDYGQPKVLPVTGGGILFASTLTGQLITVGAIAVIVVCAALLIRYVWRKNKNIGE